MRLACALIMMFAVLLVGRGAHAHKPSDARLTLTGDAPRMELRVDVALRDLDAIFHLDSDGDLAITWAEVLAKEGLIRRYVEERVTLHQGGTPCRLEGAAPLGTASHTDGAYAALSYSVTCASAAAVAVRYGLFFDRDALHRGLLRAKASDAPLIFSADAREQSLPSAGGGDDRAGFASAVREGVIHIAIGADHLLFVLALLLPVALRRKEGRTFGQAALDVAKLVTAFTLAHSVTLSLAALDFVRLPSRLVETSIAISVALTALDNFRREPSSRERWLLAFSLGLLHGFGFSSVLAELGLAPQSLAKTLVGFNVGVELGQLGFVLAVFPILYAVGHRPLLGRRVLPALSFAVALVGAAWAIERGFEVRILPAVGG